MELDFKIYPRGFIFSEEKLNKLPSEYETQLILEKYFYSYCKNVNKLVYEKENEFVIIHGNAAYVHHEHTIYNNELPKYILDLYLNDYQSFLDVLDYIAGRYAVIIGNHNKIEFYQDATGARSVYYSQDYNIVSSHPHLINDNKSHEISSEVESVNKLGVNWNLSPFNNIKALSPNICLEFFSKKTERFYPRENNRFTHFSVEKRLEIAEKLWKQQHEYFFRDFSTLAFSITGGLDSRVSLAMLKEKINDIEFFTYMTELSNPDNEKNKRLLINDGLKVKELLRDVSLNHRFIKIEEASKILSEKDLKTLSKNTIGNHNYGLLRSYKKLFPDDDTLHIRSNLNEIGRANLMEKNVGDKVERVKKYFVNSFSRDNKKDLENININLQAVAEQGVKDFKYDNNRYDFHIMDLFYWENRTGRWISEILNETDVCFETFSSYNLRILIEISLSFEFDQRKSSFFFKELINRNYPILNFYGINSKKNLYEEYKKLAQNIQNRSKTSSLLEYSQKSSEKIYDKINMLKKDNDIQLSRFNNQLNHILMMNENNIKHMQDNIMNSKIVNNKLFSSFNVYNEDEVIEIFTEKENTIFLPTQFLYKDNYSEYSHKFNLKGGYIKLSLCNLYVNEKLSDFIKYSVSINEDKVCEEDISFWPHENIISLYNLKKEDIVTVKVHVLKDECNENLSIASQVTINYIDEVETVYNVPERVKVSSPYCKIVNQ